MYRYSRHPLYLYFPRVHFFRVLRIVCIATCVFSLIALYFIVKLFNVKHDSVPEVTRLYPTMPLTIDLRSYPVCHPQELYLDNLILQYHNKFPDKNKQICFLIENLDGGPWWSYVTHEFAEILTDLKQLSIESNITYRSFSDHTKLSYKTNLTKYFLDACNFDESRPNQSQPQMVILLWDINQLLWHRTRQQWETFFQRVSARLVVFIDDLHFTTQRVFDSRQYLFQSVASEIFSTYAYLFRNYYTDIAPKKVIWLPHAASSSTRRVINQTAENILFVSGANMVDWYPCRARAFSVCHDRKDLAACLRHPGYGPTMRNTSSHHYGGERYYSYMRKYVFGLGTCQSVRYAIAKLFEIPANGLTLVTTNDLVAVLDSLHLYQNEHFLIVDCSSTNTLKNEILRLQNIPKANISQIRQKSQAVIHERHLTRHRAELIHVRLLAQALLVSSQSVEGNIQWEQWGRNCQQ